MTEYTIPYVNIIALFPLNEFYGFDHPKYIDVFMEFAEDRNKITDLIGNAIVQRVHDDPTAFREMLAMQLGYMGIDATEEPEFFENLVGLVGMVCNRCSPKLVGKDLKFISVDEDTEWVNLIYAEQLEPQKCVTLPQYDSTNSNGFLGSKIHGSYTKDSSVKAITLE